MDSGTKIFVLGGHGAVDCTDLAARAGEPAQGKSVAVVDDLKWRGGAGAGLRDSSFSGAHLADSAGGDGVVLFWPQYGGKDGDAGDGDCVVGRSASDSER